MRKNKEENMLKQEKIPRTNWNEDFEPSNSYHKINRCLDNVML